MALAGNIIVVDDEPLTRTAIVQSLANAGHNVRAASDAAACSAALEAAPADLVILDIGLPGEDGLSYGRKLRAAGDFAILFVTVDDSAVTEVTALDAGADGYLVKPIDLAALGAHVRMLLRRRNANSSNRVSFAGVTLDLERRTMTGPGMIASPSRGEFNLIALLAQADGKIVSRELLSEAVNGGQSGAGSDIRSVDALVSRLRRKFRSGEVIVTVPGFGYRLAAAVERE